MVQSADLLKNPIMQWSRTEKQNLLSRRFTLLFNRTYKRNRSHRARLTTFIMAALGTTAVCTKLHSHLPRNSTGAQLHLKSQPWSPVIYNIKLKLLGQKSLLRSSNTNLWGIQVPTPANLHNPKKTYGTRQANQQSFLRNHTQTHRCNTQMAHNTCKN